MIENRRFSVSEILRRDPAEKGGHIRHQHGQSPEL
jgi:hypothetical protein